MEKMILSLKNLYMLLMNEDFPIYSESVIGRAERKGQTMLRFWQGILVEEFRCLPCGKMIWRNDGKRNRYTSYLCNRSAEIKTYSEYAKELAYQVTEASLSNQIQRFARFLSARKYRHDILIRRIKEFVRLVEAEDYRVSAEIAAQIREAASEDCQNYGGQGHLFQAAYLMTLLMLYGAAGEAMNEVPMAVLRKEEYGMNCLWDAYRQPSATKPDGLVFLTFPSSLLQGNYLPQHRFFGREEELFNLKELAASNQKCLITGIGGIGKTELLRQLICRCTDEKVVDKIAVVPYENDIIESFARCFEGFKRQEAEDSFQMILHRLSKEAEQNKVLLLIDNLTNGIEEDPPLAKLSDLNCAVLITTRRNALEGFEPFYLQNTSVSTGALIFRDNYGYPLDKTDQAVLTEMLADELLCHPLTLKLMARAAGGKKWSVQELRKQLSKQNLSFTWQEEGRTERLSRIYRQLYSYIEVPLECQHIAELFTLLPRDSYDMDFMSEYFPSVIGAENDAAAKFHGLTEGGWLDTDGKGWSMHPLIAQCLRRKIIHEEHINKVTECIKKQLHQTVCMNPSLYENEKFQRISHILIYTMNFVSGSISRELLVAVLKAMCVLFNSRRSCGQYLKLLNQIMKRCNEKDVYIDVLYATVLGTLHCGDASFFVAVYDKQKEWPTVSKEMFLDFCINAGECLIYKQEYEKAEMLLKEALCEEASPMHRANAYYNLCILSEMRGDAETFLKWIEEGLDYVKGHPQCGEYLTFHIMSAACGAYVKFGQGESAAALLPQIKELAERSNLPTVIAEYEETSGAYELYYGDLEKALEHYRYAAKQSEAFFEEDPNFIQNLGQTAIVLQRLKRYEEALDTYAQALEGAKKNNYTQLIHLFSNNISVLYLEMENPREALVHLEVALELAGQQGGIALGEVQRNRARAFGQLGDTEQEYTCLTEAVPLLEEAYGAEHPRVLASRQRLEELNRILNE